ncbi:MAG TPA: CocE/NonD family hydrolase [Candidatus Binatia bacterium]|nr:CocE/NonD family hydrolase [Candidatus Binatia bacterium]
MRGRQLLPLLLAVFASSPLAARANLHVQGGIRFVAVTGSATGALLTLEDRRGDTVAQGTTDRFGSLLFRDLQPGRGYVVRDARSGETAAVSVLSFDDVPSPDFYRRQSLQAGLQYIETRDGTLLAAMVRPPLGHTLAEGPFPTVVEYSGYPAADPQNPQPSTLIASALGYATVGVNMRGSGCSGGVFDLFDLPTTADGYDVIEVVAAQPWVAAGKVGMVGISFPGISQLFVGGARPPHLAAIAPLSVIADIYRAPGFPGGIFNDGFAASWLADRAHDAEPAPEGGQAYAIAQVKAGDAVCLANQRLRLQTLDPVAFTEAHPYYTPSLMDQRSPINWVHAIAVPTFLGDSWQDEQTGGDFASMLRRLPQRPDVKITLTNGVHTSPLDPDILWNWLAFLDLYVAGRIPDPGRLAPIAPLIYQQILGGGTPTPPLPTDRFAGITDYAQARSLFESDPHVRVLMENGAGSAVPGLPAPTFQLAFRAWPPPQAHPVVWYFGPRGTLTPRRSRADAGDVDAYRPDPAARPQQTIPGQGETESWELLPPYDWRPLPGDTAVAYATPPLPDDVLVAGPGSVDLWLRSSAPDTDLQVTLTEIRPDGLETYVQNGWLRASHRHLDGARSTKLFPYPTHLERDARPLPAGRFTKVRVGLFSVAHVFRAGSRIRISIEAPGGDRTRWAFATPATDGLVVNEIARTKRQPSRLVLAVVRGVPTPPGLPPCPGLRGQPCRAYVPAANGG